MVFNHSTQEPSCAQLFHFSPESSQLLTYTDDVDLNAKLDAWESFYNYDRPHISHDGQTPYEVMRLLLNNGLELTNQTLTD